MISIEKALVQYKPEIKNYPDFVYKSIVRVFKSITHEKDINNFFTDNTQIGLALIDKIIEELNVSYKLNSKELLNIPSRGKVIIIANHPIGSVDAFCLLQLVASVREDKKVKIVANELLSHFKDFGELFIPVDNMSGKLSKRSLIKIHDSLKAEEAVIMFPSGEVSRVAFNGIKDSKFKAGFLKIAKKTSTPILPVYIGAKNSKMFYLSSIAYKPLGALLLPHEMFNSKDSILEFKIGAMVSHETIRDMNLSYKQHCKLFRKHIYKIANGKKGIYKTEQCIAHPASKQLLKHELNKADNIGATYDNKQIYLIEDMENFPTVLDELGRLREYTFRKVGEGTGGYKDTDKYDKYFHHIILWDDQDLEIVGSYRIGDSSWILSWLGKDGLYLDKFCNMSNKFEEYLEDSIELGRSFVQPKYWGSRALDYLWQGIGAYLSHNPHIKYMIGSVSISGTYPKSAQDALVYFYTKYFQNKTYGLSAKTPYSLSKYEEEEFSKLFSTGEYKTDFRKLKEYLGAFNVSVPTLYKQYSELCEDGGIGFMDFGIDEDFNKCLDGYIIVDVNKIKKSKKDRYIQGISKNPSASQHYEGVYNQGNLLQT